MADFFPDFGGSILLNTTADPEQIYCVLLQDIFRSSVRLIEVAITAPLFLYRTYRNSLKRIQGLLLFAVETQLIIIEQEIIKALSFDAISLAVTGSDFCTVLKACQALTDIILDDDNTLLGLTPAQKEAARTTEEFFDEYVCKLSLRNLFENYFAGISDEILSRLDELLGILNSFSILDTVDKYLQSLQDTGILDLIDGLNKFNNCAFSLCNVDAESANAKSDFASKLGITEQGGTWFVEVDDFLSDLLEKNTELNTRIANARLKVTNGRVTRGIPEDQTAK